MYLYPTRVENAPDGARDNTSKSGWMELSVFEDWLLILCVPDLNPLHSPHVLIGDKFFSHVSHYVIQKCSELDVRFVLLPPNSTHLTQPLDVAFFKPLKASWRRCLDDWKKKNRGCITKSEFPKLLQKTLQDVKIASKQNICSGFRAM